MNRLKSITSLLRPVHRLYYNNFKQIKPTFDRSIKTKYFPLHRQSLKTKISEYIEKMKQTMDNIPQKINLSISKNNNFLSLLFNVNTGIIKMEIIPKKQLEILISKIYFQNIEILNEELKGNAEEDQRANKMLILSDIFRYNLSLWIKVIDDIENQSTLESLENVRIFVDLIGDRDFYHLFEIAHFFFLQVEHKEVKLEIMMSEFLIRTLYLMEKIDEETKTQNFPNFIRNEQKSLQLYSEDEKNKLRDPIIFFIRNIVCRNLSKITEKMFVKYLYLCTKSEDKFFFKKTYQSDFLDQIVFLNNSIIQINDDQIIPEHLDFYLNVLANFLKNDNSFIANRLYYNKILSSTLRVFEKLKDHLEEKEIIDFLYSLSVKNIKVEYDLKLIQNKISNNLKEIQKIEEKPNLKDQENQKELMQKYISFLKKILVLLSNNNIFDKEIQENFEQIGIF